MKIEWMSVEQIVSKLRKVDSTALTLAIKQVKSEMPEVFAETRRQEIADYLDARNQIIN